MEFKNESGLEFKDISSEKQRTYRWESGAQVKIDNPVRLSVSSSGGHRLFDASGISHYIPAGWIHLSWTVNDGAPNFVK